MKRLLKKDFRKILKNPYFRARFPEHHDLIKQFDNKKSCCSLSDKLYHECIDRVIQNPDKWKKFLGTDSILLYYGNPKSVHKI